MKKSAFVLIFCCLAAACADKDGVRAQIDADGKLNGVIYGTDSVRDLQDDKIQGSALLQRNIKASAALVAREELKQNGDTTWKLNDKTVQERYRTCDEFKMSDQVSAAFCSAVLVAPNVILTAAHCLEGDTLQNCGNSDIVFGFDQKIEKSTDKILQNSQVYHCKHIREISKSQVQVDYALVELDRNVEGVTPVGMPAQIQAMAIGEDIYTIGYPVGTSKKMASGRVREFAKSNQNPKASLDIYYGNSGGPIFDTKTNDLVGVVANGEEDFIKTAQECQMPKHCDDNGCLGEMLTPLSKISTQMNPQFLKALQSPGN